MSVLLDRSTALLSPLLILLVVVGLVPDHSLGAGHIPGPPLADLAAPHHPQAGQLPTLWSQHSASEAMTMQHPRAKTLFRHPRKGSAAPSVGGVERAGPSPSGFLARKKGGRKTLFRMPGRHHAGKDDKQANEDDEQSREGIWGPKSSARQVMFLKSAILVLPLVAFVAWGVAHVGVQLWRDKHRKPWISRKRADLQNLDAEALRKNSGA